MAFIINILISVLGVYSKSKSDKIRTAPNIVMVVFDDMGWSDVGFNGGTYPTTNIDALHSHSIS